MTPTKELLEGLKGIEQIEDYPLVNKKSREMGNAYLGKLIDSFGKLLHHLFLDASNSASEIRPQEEMLSDSFIRMGVTDYSAIQISTFQYF